MNQNLEWDEAPAQIEGAVALWEPADQTLLLSKILQLTLGPQQSGILSRGLIKEFGSLPAVLSRAADLSTFPGIGKATIRSLKLQFELAEKLARERVSCDEPLIHSWSALMDYLNVTMSQLRVEHFRVMFLNKKNRLIADEILHKGTVDHAPFYSREVIKRCLELSATAVILVHNHPSGDPTPSPGDARLTKAFADISHGLGITVHDHIIIGKSGHASFRRLNLL